MQKQHSTQEHKSQRLSFILTDCCMEVSAHKQRESKKQEAGRKQMESLKPCVNMSTT